MLVLRGVTKTYGAVRALDGIDLDVPDGKTTVLIGPSGCGKSTLLRAVIALIRPDAGTIRLDDVAVTAENALEIRRRMGYVIQEGGLFPHLTARGNVVLMARWLGWENGRVEQRIGALAELVQLDPAFLDRYPAELSGGQRQRVGIMRALMLDPSVLLLDEPLGALDPMIRAELQVDLRDIFHAIGRTVLLVTHDLGEAAVFADRIVLMRDGRIVQTGTPEELVNDPADAFVERFINAQRSPLDALRAGGS